MKKVSLQTLVNYIDTNAIAELSEIRDEIANELARNEVKAQANRDAYTEAKDVIFRALTKTPVTISELYEEVKDELPDGFTKAKVQYAVTRLWKDEVVKTEGKVNTYSVKE